MDKIKQYTERKRSTGCKSKKIFTLKGNKNDFTMQETILKCASLDDVIFEYDSDTGKYIALTANGNELGYLPEIAHRIMKFDHFAVVGFIYSDKKDRIVIDVEINFNPDSIHPIFGQKQNEKQNNCQYCGVTIASVGVAHCNGCGAPT